MEIEVKFICDNIQWVCGGGGGYVQIHQKNHF